MMNDKWLEIPSYSGYIINDRGEIIRKAATVLRNGKIKHVKQRILKQNRNKKGYVSVNLSTGDCTKTLYVHRLVYSAFNPEQDISYIITDENNAGTDITEYADYNNDWFLLYLGEFNFESQTSIIRTVQYNERG